MTTGLNLEFAHAVVMVCDLERMIGFYTDVLGFEVTDRGPLNLGGNETEIVFLSQTATHHHQIAFAGGRGEIGRSNSVDHLAFRASGTLDDLRALKARLETDSDVKAIRPITHGNAWSVYFRDPEGNGVEVFIDTPWHVKQPQGRPLDLAKADDEITAWTQETFKDEGGFGPIDEFYERRSEHLASLA